MSAPLGLAKKILCKLHKRDYVKTIPSRCGLISCVEIWEGGGGESIDFEIWGGGVSMAPLAPLAPLPMHWMVIITLATVSPAS